MLPKEKGKKKLNIKIIFIYNLNSAISLVPSEHQAVDFSRACKRERSRIFR